MPHQRWTCRGAGLPVKALLLLLVALNLRALGLRLVVRLSIGRETSISSCVLTSARRGWTRWKPPISRTDGVPATSFRTNPAHREGESRLFRSEQRPAGSSNANTTSIIRAQIQRSGIPTKHRRDFVQPRCSKNAARRWREVVHLSDTVSWALSINASCSR